MPVLKEIWKEKAKRKNDKELNKGGSVLDINVIRNISDFRFNLSKDGFIDFLYNHLGEFGDTKEAITKAVDYAFSNAEGKGGFLLTAYIKEQLVGALVMNKTGMSEYIPENILVYVAAHENWQGVGIGRYLIEKAMEVCDGDIALHVEHDNETAIKFYEKMDFNSKYLEMRWERNK